MLPVPERLEAGLLQCPGEYIGGGVFRLPVITTNSSGTGNYFVDYGNLPLGGDILPDSVWNFQFWYRDPAFGGATFNLTDALNVEFCP